MGRPALGGAQQDVGAVGDPGVEAGEARDLDAVGAVGSAGLDGVEEDDAAVALQRGDGAGW